MATYAIGDVQGCFDALQRLLEKIRFDPAADCLWFTGDLVNRGTHSLETLRFIKQLPHKQVVLGNHDLHLLALAHGVGKDKGKDTLHEILHAPDRNELMHWLAHQPLLHHDPELDYVMVHASIAPNWTLAVAEELSREVETVMQSPSAKEFFSHLYGNHPDHWHSGLKGMDRLRCIVNYFTRARFCYPDGRLDLTAKGRIDDHPHLMPWFKLPHRTNSHLKIIFGHWAALSGETNTPNVFALDTGCVWGYALTAMRLEDGHRVRVECK